MYGFLLNYICFKGKWTGVYPGQLVILSWSQMVVALCTKMNSTEHICWLVGGVILHLGTASYILLFCTLCDPRTYLLCWRCPYQERWSPWWTVYYNIFYLCSPGSPSVSLLHMA